MFAIFRTDYSQPLVHGTYFRQSLLSTNITHFLLASVFLFVTAHSTRLRTMSTGHDLKRRWYVYVGMNASLASARVFRPFAPDFICLLLSANLRASGQQRRAQAYHVCFLQDTTSFFCFFLLFFSYA
ncbi:hypothetical protein F5Y19DRAFT_208086 [Xylariaceae sp. FL1651]|nr:hypothetical protein F5Y19DRAFT_208086 [Xylariaceae sp. FL1651]